MKYACEGQQDKRTHKLTVSSRRSGRQQHHVYRIEYLLLHECKHIGGGGGGGERYNVAVTLVSDTHLVYSDTEMIEKKKLRMASS